MELASEFGPSDLQRGCLDGRIAGTQNSLKENSPWVISDLRDFGEQRWNNGTVTRTRNQENTSEARWKRSATALQCWPPKSPRMSAT
jgi:hypothetical protein